MSHQLDVVIKFLSTTVGREKVCKLVQYLAMYVLNSNTSNKDGFEKLHHNMWITRKLLRFGLLWHYIKQIKEYTEPKDYTNEQGAGKLKKVSGKISHGDSEEEGKEAPSAFAALDFDVPSLKALSIISNALFCISDIPLLFQEMKLINWSVSKLRNIHTIKHILWIMSCLFTLGKQYILLRGVNVKIQRFKELAFMDKKTQESRKFNGKITNHFTFDFWCFQYLDQLIFVIIEKSEMSSINKDLSKLIFGMVRTMLDLFLPLHYLGIREMDHKNVGIIGSISAAMSLFESD